MTLKDAMAKYKGIGPGFHFLRHALSLAIVLFHCRQVVFWAHSAQVLAATGVADAAVAAQAQANGPAQFTLTEIVRPAFHSMVGMFFALSGFLIVGSAVRTGSIGKFFANRVLRIFPALSVETLLSALILGPLATSLPIREYLSHPEFHRYFGNIVGWIYFYLPGVFVDNPYPRVVNGQLWTLPSEFYCYLVMLGVMAFGLINRRGIIAALVGVAVVIWLGLFLYDPVAFPAKNLNFYTPNYIILMFWFGAVFFLYAEYVPLSAPFFIAAIGLYWVSIFFNALTPLSGIVLTYAAVFIGFTKFEWWDRLVSSDYSYGLFLYHFPILQAYMHFLSPMLVKLPLMEQFLVIVGLGIPTTFLFAAASWRLIEKPALSLRAVFARTQAVNPLEPDQPVGRLATSAAENQVAS